MASVDYFLKLADIKGEATDDKHKDEIEIESFSFGGSQSTSFGSGGGGGAGKVQLQDLHFTKKLDKASANLFLNMCNGKGLKEATLTCRKAGGDQQEYLTITLSEVMVSSYQDGGSSGALVPMDQFSLAYSKIKMEYKPQNPDGTLGAPTTAGWDRAKNTKI
jgi:type VI secretion system secreted protein Hcp